MISFLSSTNYDIALHAKFYSRTHGDAWVSCLISHCISLNSQEISEQSQNVPLLPVYWLC